MLCQQSKRHKIEYMSWIKIKSECLGILFRPRDRAEKVSSHRRCSRSTGSGPGHNQGPTKLDYCAEKNFADGLHGNHRLKILTACNAPYPHSLPAQCCASISVSTVAPGLTSPLTNHPPFRNESMHGASMSGTSCCLGSGLYQQSPIATAIH
jgi:hypothetical protein